MEAVCGGARSAGGTTVGVLPGSDPSLANEHVDIPVCTGIGYARNVIVVKTGGGGDSHRGGRSARSPR